MRSGSITGGRMSLITGGRMRSGYRRQEGLDHWLQGEERLDHWRQDVIDHWLPVEEWVLPSRSRGIFRAVTGVAMSPAACHPTQPSGW